MAIKLTIASARFTPIFPIAHTESYLDSSTYDDTMEWLSTVDSREDARLIASDIQSHRTIGQGRFVSPTHWCFLCLSSHTDFPARTFIEHLFELTQTRLERSYPKAASSQRPVLVSSINTTLQKFKDVLHTHKMKLLQLYNFSVRRSPKRRTYSVGTSDQGRLVNLSLTPATIYLP